MGPVLPVKSMNGRDATVNKSMYAVIMAGGKGTRFWPRSRENKPKHLLEIFSVKTILRETVDRIKPLIPEDNIFVVTGHSHAKEVARQLPDVPKDHILVEPVGRNTAPCIGLAALHVRKSDPEGVMVVLPSDHFIRQEKAFLRILSVAGQAAAAGEKPLVTVGITPSRPETGYGYIERGDRVAHFKKVSVYRAASFREKPELKKARAFVRSGRFLWNSGIFVWKASTILQAIAAFLPGLGDGLREIDAALGMRREESVVKRIYRATASVSIDYGVMEKSNNVLLVEGDFGWSDVGNWDALWELAEKDSQGNVLIGKAMTVDAHQSYVYSKERLVALVGVEDLIVVETRDSVLICRRGSSQKVRSVVDALEKNRMRKYL
jgi:mannose-1-phosphate guanylyltransferase